MKYRVSIFDADSYGTALLRGYLDLIPNVGDRIDVGRNISSGVDVRTVLERIFHVWEHEERYQEVKLIVSRKEQQW